MKGFPNQVGDLGKLAQGMSCVMALVDQNANPKDDGLLGEALVRAGVIGTGHTPVPVENYLRAQRTKTLDRQSFRTSARGLRELYRLLGLIEETDGSVRVTREGREAAAFAADPLGPSQIEFWRRVILNFRHYGGDPTASHPYQVLLHLIARRPGITRAQCALALEARDDSPEELLRIVNLSALSEDRIRERIGVSKSNWDNAKKIIPRFAEQLGDVIKTGQTYRLADAPGRGDGGSSERSEPSTGSQIAIPHRPRTSREVTPATIGTAGIAEPEEPPLPPTLDPLAAAAASQLRLERLRRHNILVRMLATRLAAARMTLFADPFDILAVLGRVGILCEIKTLDGSVEDERERVRDALSQLLYYEAFLTTQAATGVAIHKIACFERPISAEHQRWLNQSRIATVWVADGRLAGDALAAGILGPYLEELR